jgi:predicted N-acetyltransferase YhbS
MSISVQPFTKAELEATDEILKAAYQVEHSRKESLRRYLAFQPGGSFVAKHNGTIVGFGGAIDYGFIAYIEGGKKFLTSEQYF